MIKVYHAPWSRSDRVVWLLEELGSAIAPEGAPGLKMRHEASASAAARPGS